MFDTVIGQTPVKHFFQRAFENARLSHAYLLVGPRGVGKEAMAITLAERLLASSHETGIDPRVANLSHPDLHLTFPSPAKATEQDQQVIKSSIIENPYSRYEPWANPSISIHKIREIRKKAAFKSFEGQGRVLIIYDCERMTIEAANALLKILEEPPDKMYLLMTSSMPSVLLPTIKSRCQVVKFDPLQPDLIEDILVKDGVEASKARLAARLSGGSYKRSLELLGDDLNKMQQLALDFLRKGIQNSFTQILFVDELLQQFQRDTKNIKELLSHLLIWLRDSLVYRESENDAAKYLVHFEDTEVLKNFNNNFPNADLNSAVLETENSLELLERNVQVNLILIVLLNKLRAYIRR